MMRARQIPSADCFVVKTSPGASPAGRRNLAGRVALEKIEGSDLLLLKLGEVHPEPKTAWQRVLDGMESAQWVAPVLLDEQSQPHFPTGDVSVRFDHTPSETELEKFAAAHGLELKGRNEFIPEQASFRPADLRHTYLPDLLRALGSEKGVAAAWANTLSRYRPA